MYHSYDAEPLKVLLVSNNLVDIKKIEQQLLDPSFLVCRLFCSKSFNEALTQLNKPDNEFGIVILDVRLSEKSFVASLCSQIYSAAVEAQIILLTDHESADYEDYFYEEVGAIAQINRNKLYSLQSLLRLAVYPDREIAV